LYVFFVDFLSPFRLLGSTLASVFLSGKCLCDWWLRVESITQTLRSITVPFIFTRIYHEQLYVGSRERPVSLLLPRDFFLQYNAEIYIARKTIKLLQRIQFRSRNTPPYSPDLNPIEHI
jgi:hypothetical protein